MSKMVPSDELGFHTLLKRFIMQTKSLFNLGKIYSLFSLCEALMPLVCGPMYSFVYNSTINRLPGFFYLFRVIFPLPSLFIFL